MYKAQHIETNKWLCNYLRKHLASNEKDASVFLDKQFIEKYIKDIGYSPIQFRIFKCDYTGKII